jgi:acetolactate synthase-1/2/3 large subunit
VLPNSIPDPTSRICPVLSTHRPPIGSVSRKPCVMINRCERPIILCGHGVISSNAGSTAAPLCGKGQYPGGLYPAWPFRMPVDHPLSLGMVGMHGTVEANRALLNADLIISMGMRFDDRVTGNLATFRA